MKRFFFASIFSISLLLPCFVFAETFFVQPDFDSSHRNTIEAEAQKTGRYSLMYVEDGLTVNQSALNTLYQEFETNIYPRLTGLFGVPWTPGIDSDERITVLITKMINNVGGYFNNSDEFPRSVVSDSNEREMIYINSAFLNNKRVKAFLAHEFQHLISFNQKTRRLEKSDPTWLNEVRSEYAPTYLGYDEDYKGSNLEERVRFFVDAPNDNLIGWLNTQYDYGSVNLFGQYLAGQFSSQVFQRMMQNDEVGIPSIEEALRGVKAPFRFQELFARWRLTNYVNRSDIFGGSYSYNNPNISFILPPEDEASLATLSPGEEKALASTPLSPFASRSFSIKAGDNPILLTISTNEASDNFLLPYVKTFSNGTYEDGMLTFSGKEGSIALDTKQGAKEVLLTFVNASELTPTRFFVKAKALSKLDPLIADVSYVFINPALSSRAIIKGEHFQQGARLLLNGVAAPVTYQNDTTLLADIPPSLGTSVSITVRNPDEGQITFDWTRIVPASFSEGSLVKAAGDYKVYIIGKGYRRHIIDAKIFSFYDHLRASSPKEVTEDTLDSYKESTLVRAADSPKVYEILPNGQKTWIKTVQDFTARGFDWNAVFLVNERELAFYPET